MSTNIRPEVSEKNKYYIPKHRFYELRHFCLQYPMWKKKLTEIDGYKTNFNFEKIPGGGYSKSSVENALFNREELLNKIDLIDKCIYLSEPTIFDWLRKGITQGVSYTILESRYDIPCSKDMYYDRYRKFFWILNSKRK